jgi:pilus assembly protein CpaE
MAASGNPTRVALVGDPGPVQQQITAAFGSQGEFVLVDVLINLEKLSRDLRAAEPELILVDQLAGGQPTLDILDDLALQFPEVPLVAILPDNDPLRAQQVMLAGARAFIVQPFTQVNLLSTLRRVRELEGRRQQSQAAIQAGSVETLNRMHTLAVYSPRGGSGCSTISTNLAIAWHEMTKARVLLVDGKLFFGHLGLMLNVRSQNTLADLIPHAHMLDEGLVKEVVFEHISGIHILLSPDDVQIAQGIRSQDLFNVISGLQRLYDFIVIDTGSAFTENAVTLMDSADRVLLVTNPELSALHDASRFIQLSRSLAYPAGKLLTVLNRAGMPGSLRTRDVEIALRHEVFTQVPDDSANALRSLNRGIPLILKYPRSPATRGLQNLAKQLRQLDGGEMAGKPVRVSGKASPNSPRLAASRSS